VLCPIIFLYCTTEGTHTRSGYTKTTILILTAIYRQEWRS